MSVDELKEISNKYEMYAGSANNSIHKTGFAAENFEQVLSAAISLCSENKYLRKKYKEVNNYIRESERDHCDLPDKDEIDESKDAADFARYG